MRRTVCDLSPCSVELLTSWFPEKYEIPFFFFQDLHKLYTFILTLFDQMFSGGW